MSVFSYYSIFLLSTQSKKDKSSSEAVNDAAVGSYSIASLSKNNVAFTAEDLIALGQDLGSVDLEIHPNGTCSLTEGSRSPEDGIWTKSEESYLLIIGADLMYGQYNADAMTMSVDWQAADGSVLTVVFVKK